MVLIGVLRYFVSKLMRSNQVPDQKIVKEGIVSGYQGAPQPGYGYQGQPQPGYGYAPPGQHQKPKKNKMGGMGAGLGLGLGAGLLGGMLVGEMVGDADGYDDAMGGGDFDF
ncbi:hypothetical protein CASFOL_041563 [Castilleja foliolosa]|uniref:Uncharacterized protein n=1 Tax=Castilleja foliolosa TaxID=1961234 RepID=A0ABD3BC89_9LAMI